MSRQGRTPFDPNERAFDVMAEARCRAGPGRPPGTVSARAISSRGGSAARVGGRTSRRVTIRRPPVRKALSLSVRCARGSPTWCSPNVLDNAVKSHRPGGQVVIETDAEWRSGRCPPVSDAGPGIPAERGPRSSSASIVVASRGPTTAGLRSGAGISRRPSSSTTAAKCPSRALRAAARPSHRLPVRLIVACARSPRTPARTIAADPQGFSEVSRRLGSSAPQRRECQRRVEDGFRSGYLQGRDGGGSPRRCRHRS